MLMIRRFDEKLLDLFFQRKMSGFVHTSLGHEAIAVGAISALQSQDQVVSYYRGHGHCLAKGLSPKRLFDEILGKKTGYSKGRSGSVQLMNPESGVIASSGIVAQGLPIAVGAALANKMRANKRIVVVFFGDGATNNGVFFESLNCAAYLKLPLIFVCENNGLATSVRTEQTMANVNIHEKAKALGVQSQCVDGMDVEKVYTTVRQMAKKARADLVPFFLECKTRRLLGHTVADRFGAKIESKISPNFLAERDPLQLLKDKLIRSKLATKKALEKINTKDVLMKLDQALESSMKETPSESSDAFTSLFQDYE